MCRQSLRQLLDRCKRGSLASRQEAHLYTCVLAILPSSLIVRRLMPLFVDSSPSKVPLDVLSYHQLVTGQQQVSAYGCAVSSDWPCRCSLRVQLLASLASRNMHTSG